MSGAEPVDRVPEGALADLREPVTACPACGHLGIRPPSLGEGVAVGGGELIHEVCPRCHYRGPAVRFDTREEYAAFVDSLHEGDPVE